MMEVVQNHLNTALATVSSYNWNLGLQLAVEKMETIQIPVSGDGCLAADLRSERHAKRVSDIFSHYARKHWHVEAFEGRCCQAWQGLITKRPPGNSTMDNVTIRPHKLRAQTFARWAERKDFGSYKYDY